MKKLLAATLALALMLAMAVPALAMDYGSIDDVYFDSKFVIEFPVEELIKAADEAGVEDPVSGRFTLEDLVFKITLGSDYVKVTKKEYDDQWVIESESSEPVPESSSGSSSATNTDPVEVQSLELGPQTISGKGIRITLNPVDDYTVAEREVRFEYYFLRSHSGSVVKTEAVKGSFKLVRQDILKDEIKTLAGEKFPVRLTEDVDIISADRFSEGAGKNIGILSPKSDWQLNIKNISENQKGINVNYNTVADDNVTEAFPNAKFQCVNFLSPNAYMATRATLDINLDADGLGLKGPEQTVWLYSFDGKSMTLEGSEKVNVYEQDLTVTFDIDGKTILGSYYVSDTELKATEKPAENGAGNGTAGAENPNTGAADYVGTACALAVAALVAAAAVSVGGKLRG